LKINETKNELKRFVENNETKIMDEIVKLDAEYKYFLSSLEYPTFMAQNEIKNINYYIEKYNSQLKQEE
jgi:hypothetical protein